MFMSNLNLVDMLKVIDMLLYFAPELTSENIKNFQAHARRKPNARITIHSQSPADSAISSV